MPAMLLLLQDISSPFWQRRRCYPGRARLYPQSLCAVEGQRLLALLAQHVTFERTNPARRLCPRPSSS